MEYIDVCTFNIKMLKLIIKHKHFFWVFFLQSEIIPIRLQARHKAVFGYDKLIK